MTNPFHTLPAKVEIATDDEVIVKGEKGDPGPQGKSDYDIAVANGFSGDETAWLASLKGERGDQGDAGLQGSQGEEGPTGPRGFQGEQGERGVQGFQGEVGPEGPRGVQGEQGPQGIQGPIGLTGQTGAQGVKGDKGDTGAQGAVGATGSTGAKGDQGEQGLRGVDGPTGATGPQGPDGPAGKTPNVAMTVGYAVGSVNALSSGASQNITVTLDTTMPNSTYNVKSRGANGVNTLSMLTFTVLARSATTVMLKVTASGSNSPAAVIYVDTYAFVVTYA